jgi:hypothetical protein
VYKRQLPSMIVYMKQVRFENGVICALNKGALKIS